MKEEMLMAIGELYCANAELRRVIEQMKEQILAKEGIITQLSTQVQALELQVANNDIDTSEEE